MFVVFCGRHDPSIHVGGWNEAEASKPEAPPAEKAAQPEKKAWSFRSGHGASGDQNGLEVVFCQFFLLKKTWECIYLDSQGVTPLFDTFTLGFCHVLSLF